jgi:hypothetical protein
MKITITTNHHPRELISLADLSRKEARDFDYIKGEDRYSSRLFRYRGACYDICEFSDTRTLHHAPEEFKNWHGYQSDSYFSGVLIRYDDNDFDRVIVGRYVS